MNGTNTNIIILSSKIIVRQLQEFKELREQLYELDIDIKDSYFNKWRDLLNLLSMFIRNSDIDVTLEYKEDIERMKYILWLDKFIEYKEGQVL